MKRRHRKRSIEVCFYRVDRDDLFEGEPDGTRRILVSPRVFRLQRFYDRHDMFWWVGQDPALSARMVAVLRRKPRAGRGRG